MIGAVESKEIVRRQVRHGKWIVREVDLLLLLVPFVHRKVYEPAELDPVAVDQPELLADPGARGANELEKLLRLPRGEEDGIALIQRKHMKQTLDAVCSQN